MGTECYGIILQKQNTKQVKVQEREKGVKISFDRRDPEYSASGATK